MDPLIANAILDLMNDEEHTEEVKNAIAFVKKDLYYALSTASNCLYYYHKNLWATMDAELETEARQWVLQHDELTLIEGSDDGYFQYYDNINEEVCHHLPHLPKPNRFSHEEEYEEDEAGWVCKDEVGWVCVAVDTLVPC
jgi:hypothetical protein